MRDALTARIVDEMHVAVVPIVLGDGEALWPGLPEGPDGYACAEIAGGEGAAHLRFVRA